MNASAALIKRNTKLFFKDKGMFFTSLITPLILLVLYATFLANIYKDNLLSAMPAGLLPDKMVDGFVSGQLCSSLLAVCCITVAFNSNLLTVQDKISLARDDLTVTPVRGSSMAVGYFVSTAIVTMIVCFVTLGASFIYLYIQGWYLSAADVILSCVDVFLLSLFGTALASCINFFLSTQGQLSAVSAIICSCYGFFCGAYMPIASFGEGLRKALSFLPGTYGTSLIRNHLMGGVCREMSSLGVPEQAIEQIRDGIDCNIYCMGEKVSIPVMYTVFGGTVVLLAAVYVAFNIIAGKKAKKR